MKCEGKMMIACNFCGLEFNSELSELDPYDNKRGFWCLDCDGYNFFNRENGNSHKFTLILESGSKRNTPAQIAPIRLKKRLSPLRYPGGKSKIAHLLYWKLSPSNIDTLISPYSGGASVELSLLNAGVVKRIILNDYEYGVFALFKVIKENPEALITRVLEAQLGHDDFFRSREIIKSGYAGCSLLEAAWSMLIVNRLSFSGIYYANPLGGLQGSREQLLSRWNTQEICRRIRIIHAMSDAIVVLNQDACDLIEEAYWYHDSTILVDPPYFKQGKKLYRYYYEEEDHRRLNFLLESLFKGFPGADILLCYDDVPFIEELYTYPKIERIDRAFSV